MNSPNCIMFTLSSTPAPIIRGVDFVGAMHSGRIILVGKTAESPECIARQESSTANHPRIYSVYRHRRAKTCPLKGDAGGKKNSTSIWNTRLLGPNTKKYRPPRITRPDPSNPHHPRRGFCWGHAFGANNSGRKTAESPECIARQESSTTNHPRILFRLPAPAGEDLPPQGGCGEGRRIRPAYGIPACLASTQRNIVHRESPILTPPCPIIREDKFWG